VNQEQLLIFLKNIIGFLSYINFKDVEFIYEPNTKQYMLYINKQYCCLLTPSQHESISKLLLSSTEELIYMSEAISKLLKQIKLLKKTNILEMNQLRLTYTYKDIKLLEEFYEENNSN